MDYYTLQHIRQRMHIRGLDRYRVSTSSFITSEDVNEYRIPAYNEFFYLVAKDVANGTIIHSDINVYKVNQHYAQQVLAQVREFSGLIIIENPENTIQLLEFIRVIPQ
jgi:hypothetical protein